MHPESEQMSSNIINFGRSFGSDNHSGIHPEILAAIQAVNSNHAIAYGEDPVTKRVLENFKFQFGPEAETFLVLNGSAANVLALKALLQSHHTVLCSEPAHIHNSEVGASESWIGCKLYPLPTTDGKIRIQTLQEYYKKTDAKHLKRIRVLSLTQPTELGTVYTIDELRCLSDFAHSQGLFVHLDGARLSNAAAELNCSLKALTTEIGIDVLSFGGTKNGLLLGDAVVFLNKKHSENFDLIRQQSLQLVSKMRFLSAQFEAYFNKSLWLKNATHANAMAKYLATRIEGLSQVKITRKVQTNVVFATLPPSFIPRLQAVIPFHLWNPSLSEIRWMTSFDTTPEDIENLISAMEKIGVV